MLIRELNKKIISFFIVIIIIAINLIFIINRIIAVTELLFKKFLLLVSITFINIIFIIGNTLKILINNTFLKKRKVDISKRFDIKFKKKLINY